MIFIKRAGLVMLALMMTLLLFSCSSQEKKIEKEKIANKYVDAKGYNATLNVKAPSLSYSFILERLKPDYYRMELLEPATLKGVSIEVKGTASTVKYKSLTVPLDFVPLQIKDGIGQINDILSNLDTILDKLNAKEIEKDIEFSGKYNDIDLSIKMNKEGLIPLALNFTKEQQKYEVNITDFKLVS